jgi:hypothetical protein
MKGREASAALPKFRFPIQGDSGLGENAVFDTLTKTSLPTLLGLTCAEPLRSLSRPPGRLRQRSHPVHRSRHVHPPERPLVSVGSHRLQASRRGPRRLARLMGQRTFRYCDAAVVECTVG